MRDAKRIPKILVTLARIWQANPDLRLGQIIVDAEAFIPRTSHTPIFFIEDDDILEGLTELARHLDLTTPIYNRV